MNNTQEKKLLDYLHLYIGCPVKVGNRSTAILTPGETDAERISWYSVSMNPSYKLILRPLSDMRTTEEEKVILDYQIETSAEDMRYLLSKGFDLFGLIDAGLAIDATTLQ